MQVSGLWRSHRVGVVRCGCWVWCIYEVSNCHYRGRQMLMDDRTQVSRGRGHMLLARRSLADPGDIAYYACCGPRTSRLVDLAWIAGSRWHIEECFQQAKSEAGLDHYQVRTWRAWYAHITLSMLALAWLAASKAQAAKGEPDPAARA